MKLTFFSNFMNHHQLPLCRELYKKLGDDFSFVAFEPVPKERLELGYHDMNSEYEFIIRAYEGKSELQRAKRAILESDVAIAGISAEEYIRQRAEENRITFRYSERLYKTGIRHMFSPSFIRELVNIHYPLKHRPVYLLCAGAYVAKDFAFLGNYLGKAYKWGYFPETISYDLDELFAKKGGDPVKILWAGRLIDWKHPELAVEVANILKKGGYKFELNIIGTGDQSGKIKDLIEKYKLSDYVSMCGAKPPEIVRDYMEQSSVFLFTSDRNEGWGAVLNEAMNSGCAVVCNKNIGAVPYLVKNGYNGLVYRCNKPKYVSRFVEKLLKDENYRRQISINAYDTIVNEWNSSVAANRLLLLSEKLLNNEKSIEIKDGPCSMA